MADGDKGIVRQLQLAVLFSGVTALVLAVGLVLGIVALKARMTPHKKKPPEVALPGPMQVIKDQIYNLGEANRYLKATIVMELDNENKKAKVLAEFQDEAKKRDPQIRDIVIRIMSGKTFQEINSPAGKSQLKEEIRKKINAVLSRGEVKRILFTKFATSLTGPRSPVVQGHRPSPATMNPSTAGGRVNSFLPGKALGKP